MPDGMDEPTGGEWQKMMRSGRTSRLPSRYHTDIGAVAIMTKSTKQENNYYEMLFDYDVVCEEEDDEIACGGVGLGGGFKSK
jgi:hypothetical protein